MEVPGHSRGGLYRFVFHVDPMLASFWESLAPSKNNWKCVPIIGFKVLAPSRQDAFSRFILDLSIPYLLPLLGLSLLRFGCPRPAPGAHKRSNKGAKIDQHPGTNNAKNVVSLMRPFGRPRDPKAPFSREFRRDCAKVVASYGDDAFPLIRDFCFCVKLGRQMQDEEKEHKKKRERKGRERKGQGTGRQRKATRKSKTWWEGQRKGILKLQARQFGRSPPGLPNVFLFMHVFVWGVLYLLMLFVYGILCIYSIWPYSPRLIAACWPPAMAITIGLSCWELHHGKNIVRTSLNTYAAHAWQTWMCGCDHSPVSALEPKQV